MGYDRRRAALLALSLGALLMAATLMPAAGLGSFPAAGGDGDDGPSSADPVEYSPTETPDSDSVTTDDETETSTTTEQTDRTPTPTDDQRADRQTPVQTTGASDGDSTVIGNIIAGGLLLVLLAVFLGFLACYPLFVLAVGVVLGPKVASKLPLGGTIQSVPQVTMAGLIGVSTSLSSVARSIGAASRGIADGISMAFESTTSWLAFGSGLGSLGRGFSVGFGSLLGSFGGGLFSLFGGSGGGSTSGTATTDDARETVPPDPETVTTDEEDSGPPSIREAWDDMRDRMHVRNRDSMTPGELAREAIDRGWPPGAVEQLTDAFQQVRYGGQDPDGERLATARQAHQELREYWGDAG